MKAVISRVLEASVTVDGDVVGAVEAGDTGALLALVGVAKTDDADDVATMVRKIAELRILREERSISDTGAPVLVVSQFTLQGRTAKGRRPSWTDAAPGEQAATLLADVVTGLEARGITVKQGRFGAMMEVTSVNDGPFTVLVDTA
ncbi:MAG: D-aminoacyl-tRNA deacylase [Corynebacterium sp.]|nr:D-aminoacyl-tRNA deacylase [Corynebacterium sp.]